ncbi:MAG: glycerol-3-phosphate acyltransferase [Bryobacterales bacterium]|nr:glycerol-3-phosphate acyltransferase [Bryobacterales bacterium]
MGMIDSTIALEAFVCFLCGAIPFAVIAMWGSGVDIRRVGSGNPGFNNVLRVNKARAVATLAGDMLKGFLPLYFLWDPATDPQWQGWLYAFAAVFGHCYSPFLKFNGGKGIATSAGVMLRLFPKWALAGLAFFVLLRLTGSRRKWPEAGAVASVATWVFFTVVLWLYEGSEVARYALMMTVFLAWRHKSNIRRLIAG